MGTTDLARYAHCHILGVIYYGSEQPFSGWIKADPQVRVNAYYHELVRSLIAVCVTRPTGPTIGLSRHHIKLSLMVFSLCP